MRSALERAAVELHLVVVGTRLRSPFYGSVAWRSATQVLLTAGVGHDWSIGEVTQQRPPQAGGPIRVGAARLPLRSVPDTISCYQPPAHQGRCVAAGLRARLARSSMGEAALRRIVCAGSLRELCVHSFSTLRYTRLLKYRS